MAILPALGLTLRFPFVGVLLWAWFALQSPHREVYGFVTSLHLNLIIAVVTVAAWLLSKERKVPQKGMLFWAIVIFLLWMTFNSFFAFDPQWSWPYWDRTWKIFAWGLLIAATATSRLRVQALLWVATGSLFYFGIKGGIFTILTGGHNHVFGPPDTIIRDNNQLAVALLMTLPLGMYLRAQSSSRAMRNIVLSACCLTVIAILGTYSRGAVVGLCALAVFGLLRMRRRILYLGMSGVAVAFAVYFMPPAFTHRVDTISHASHDVSFEGRLHAWNVAYHYAVNHFPFGAGFYGPQLPAIFHRYYPHEAHAAHSIYFQVLGEHGFIGLAIYLVIITLGFINCSRLISASRDRPELRWAKDLGIALQASLFVFCVAGSALSMAYYDMFVMEVCLLLPLRAMLPARSRAPASRFEAARLGGPAFASGR